MWVGGSGVCAFVRYSVSKSHIFIYFCSFFLDCGLRRLTLTLRIFYSARRKQFIINQTKNKHKKRKTTKQTAFHHAFIRRKQKREKTTQNKQKNEKKKTLNLK